jgi:hypothetical protein
VRFITLGDAPCWWADALVVAAESPRSGSATVLRVSVVQTILVYVLIPGGIYAVIALLTLWPKFARGPRYRPGQPWTYEPVWWSADGAVAPEQSGAVPAGPAPEQTSVSTARGGARGNW